MEKKSLIEYYDELEQIVDLKCELVLFNSENQTLLNDSLNQSREKLITAIKNVCKQTLIDKSLFGFLLIPNDIQILAKFVITNKIISKNVQSLLK